MLRKDFVGGYHYRRVRAGANPDTYHESPVKNTYSHPHDALQCLLLGGGEHHVVLRRHERPFPSQFQAKCDWDVFADIPY